MQAKVDRQLAAPETSPEIDLLRGTQVEDAKKLAEMLNEHVLLLQRENVVLTATRLCHPLVI
jgi:hypothetical protein